MARKSSSRSSVLYEDAASLVVNKPAGVATLEDAGSALDSVAAWYTPFRPVHRLDNDTTGCLLLAKTEAAYAALRAQFEAGSVEKIYLVLVHGLTPQAIHLTTPMAHHAKKSDRMIAVAHADTPHRGQPQPAETHITTLQHHYPTAACPQPLSWVRVQIATGVRHQIRVHLASRGHPVVGDVLYGQPAQRGETPHHLLHAWQIGFRSSAAPERVIVTAPLPHTIHEFARGHQLEIPKKVMGTSKNFSTVSSLRKQGSITL